MSGVIRVLQRIGAILTFLGTLLSFGNTYQISKIDMEKINSPQVETQLPSITNHSEIDFHGYDSDWGDCDRVEIKVGSFCGQPFFVWNFLWIHIKN